jgi:hypothetical protein
MLQESSLNVSSHAAPAQQQLGTINRPYLCSCHATCAKAACAMPTCAVPTCASPIPCNQLFRLAESVDLRLSDCS